MLSFFPRGVLDEILNLNLIESVSEVFSSYSNSTVHVRPCFIFSVTLGNMLGAASFAPTLRYMLSSASLVLNFRSMLGSASFAVTLRYMLGPASFVVTLM